MENKTVNWKKNLKTGAKWTGLSVLAAVLLAGASLTGDRLNLNSVIGFGGVKKAPADPKKPAPPPSKLEIELGDAKADRDSAKQNLEAIVKQIKDLDKAEGDLRKAEKAYSEKFAEFEKKRVLPGADPSLISKLSDEAIKAQNALKDAKKKVADFEDRKYLELSKQTADENLATMQAAYDNADSKLSWSKLSSADKNAETFRRMEERMGKGEATLLQILKEVKKPKTK